MYHKRNQHFPQPQYYFGEGLLGIIKVSKAVTAPSTLHTVQLQEWSWERNDSASQNSTEAVDEIMPPSRGILSSA